MGAERGRRARLRVSVFAAGLTAAAASEWLLLGAADGGGAWRVARGRRRRGARRGGGLAAARGARAATAPAPSSAASVASRARCSVNDGLAVVRGGGGDRKPARVKHFPVDALCRLLARS